MNRLLAASAASVSLALFTGCHSTSHEGATYYSDSVTTSSTYSGAPSASSAPSGQSSESTVIPLYKEELKVGKRTVDAGSVQLKKTVKTETVNEGIQLRQEQISVERKPASSEAAESQSMQSGQNLSQPFQEGQMEIHLQREEPVVEKQVVSAGQIVVQKTAQSEQRNIQEQVRKDDIAVTKSGDSQNIKISDNVTSSSGMGGSAESSAQSSGAARSENAITDITMLSGARATSLNGQRVELSAVPVERSSGRLIALGSPSSENAQERPIYVCVREPQSIKAGQTVNVSGTIKATSQISQSGLSQQEQRMLQGQPFYIEAQTVELQKE